jgi:hypothetical protein
MTFRFGLIALSPSNSEMVPQETGATPDFKAKPVDRHTDRCNKLTLMAAFAP